MKVQMLRTYARDRSQGEKLTDAIKVLVGKAP